MLEQFIRQRREERDILLMAHTVLGYPNYDAGLALLEAMAKSDVDLVELQIPFSEPIADGPVILRANQQALKAGANVERCLGFAERATRRFEMPFLFMTYYNILYQYGVKEFVAAMQAIGVVGAIVPDLPPEEAEEFLSAMRGSHLDPIFIYSPNTSDERLSMIAKHARGFMYCVARKGVTGSATEFSRGVSAYLERCRAATSLPLAVGFGVKSEQDVSFLKGRADVAVVGSETLRIFDGQGVGAVGEFLRGLRPRS